MVASLDPTPTNIYDILIIGAGPCGLAVAARLCERTPSAIFTDDEHQRYNWIRRHAQNMSLKNWRNGHVKRPSNAQSPSRFSTLVLDSSADKWMSRWNTLFRTFDIRHLRSPMFFHPDPGDRDGLLAYTYEQRRETELVEIRGCVGKEMSKHQKKKKRASATGNAQNRVIVEERDRKDYQTPSTSLFDGYCNCIMDRYGLRRELIQQVNVQDITYGPVEDEFLQSSSDLGHDDDTPKLFRVQTSTGVFLSRTVVMAVGPGNAPSIPSLAPGQTLPHACHSMHIKKFPDPVISNKISTHRPTTVIVVGGGLTSAQISDLCIRKGISKVYHLMRGPLKVKPFDIGLEWMGKFRNINQAYFYSADDDETRWQQIVQARGGGSITPPYAKTLKKLEASGKLEILTHMTLDMARSTFQEELGTWKVQTNPPLEAIQNTPIDYIYFCTGVASDINTIPCLSSMHTDYPIKSCGGLPCLTDDLMWKDDVPLFITGKLAGLRLGPGAANLAGARQGAERVVWGLEDWLNKHGGRNGALDGEVGEIGVEKERERRDSAVERDEYTTARGNRFSNLEFEGIEEE